MKDKPNNHISDSHLADHENKLREEIEAGETRPDLDEKFRGEEL